MFASPCMMCEVTLPFLVVPAVITLEVRTNAGPRRASGLVLTSDTPLQEYPCVAVKVARCYLLEWRICATIDAEV